jgi:antitoxin component YwqK of YwqJK toxin-antitoxin module
LFPLAPCVLYLVFLYLNSIFIRFRLLVTYLHKVELDVNQRFKLITTIGLLLLAACSNKDPYYDLINRGGVYYEVNALTPFNGVSVNYHDNGQVKYEKYYKDGKQDGLQKSYFEVKGDALGSDREKGSLRSKENFKGGSKNGLQEAYQLNGHLKFKWILKDGIRNGFYKSYRKDGKLESNTNFKDGKLNGLQEIYYKNGQLKYATHYKDEKLDGGRKGYYDNGQLKYTAHYKDEKLDGLQQQYQQNGHFSNAICYKNGEEVDLSDCEK